MELSRLSNKTKKPAFETDTIWHRFQCYREELERKFIEPKIHTLGEITFISIEPSPLEDTAFGYAMGVNEMSNIRIKTFNEHLGKTTQATAFEEAGIRSNFINIMNQIKNVGASSCGYPWSINYYDYLKHRDGSHRRMIFNHLNINPYPSLVVNFDLINLTDKEFVWFKNKVKEYRKLI